jgi:N-acetylmuramoyl-L-alanine amidase
MADDFYGSEPYTDDDDFEVRIFDSGASGTPVGRSQKPLSPDDSFDDFDSLTVQPQTGGHSAASVPLQQRPMIRSTPAARRKTTAPRPPRAWWGTLRTLLIVGAAGVLVSTIFSLWTRPTFFTEEFRAGLNQVQATQLVINIQPSPLPTDVHEVRIGIVAGHSGHPQDPSFESDPGAVCDDGLTELQINEAVAREVVTALRRDQYTVDMMEEFDPRLEGYQADVLVSIHTNDCQDYGLEATGYNAASASSRQTTHGLDERLLNCIVAQYGATTGLPRHTGITFDMTDYHTFGEVAVDTPTAIIELGFMRNDRDFLLGQQTLIAQGIANGIRCFLRPEIYGNPGAQ